ncbi:multidrug efflux pump subunit AcrA (membrane-fusion protein) [Breznakia sp. PF5-3]|uniref:HlyD family secretion protein n=1 Tax=unclassified Breznakia TaxID=2623764 RepID=UPI002405F818|nr:MULTISPECIES: HlyD family efflux transporter periplasmic adaptor subunit [unclassified Breznakia]MDF9825856.1 multidrug efflux pump subunit AcrA (membrane-fusion protein) [Breznakia sp. PM6-1]MDF9836662.1 multidrug efflux pump subunit AcrA (membrane-fusion protein) [Breznakia sp. PF5-3]
MKFHSKEELQSSRIFFDKNPPKYIYLFVFLVCLFIVVCLWFSLYATKTYVVKANGEIITTDNQYITSNVNGTVSEIQKAEGSQVRKGDILFIANNGITGVQGEALLEQLNFAKEKLAAMDLFERSLNEKTNYLENDGVQQEYFGKVEYYLLQVYEDEINLQQQQKEYAKKSEKIVNIEKEIENLRKSTAEDSQDEIISKSSEIETLNNELDTLQLQMKSTSQNDKLRTQFISELGSSRTQVETQITELEGNRSASVNEDKTFIAKAQNDGIVHYRIPIKLGMNVQVNQIVAEVSKNDEKDYLVEAYVDAAEISKISEKNSVNISIIGVNTQIYGDLKGEIISIDNGTITQETQDGTILVYRCLIRLEQTKLNGKDDTYIQAMKSMPVEVQIIYDNESYLDWILELLSFKS